MSLYLFGVWPGAFAITYISYLPTYYDSYSYSYNEGSYDTLDVFTGTHISNDPLIVSMASLEEDVFRFENWTYNLTYYGYKEEWSYYDDYYEVTSTESSETYATYMTKHFPEYELTYVSKASYYMKEDYSNIRSIQWV